MNLWLAVLLLMLFPTPPPSTPPEAPKPLWMPSNDFIAQAAHFGWGCLIVLLFALYGQGFWGWWGVLGYATVKEFIFDKYVERQSFKDNLIDWLFWLAGSSVAVALVFYRVSQILAEQVTPVLQ